MFGSKSRPTLGLMLLGGWLILLNLLPILGLQFEGKDTLLQLLAIAAGVCLLLGR